MHLIIVELKHSQIIVQNTSISPVLGSKLKKKYKKERLRDKNRQKNLKTTRKICND